MALTPEHRAELEVLGPEIVRIRLAASDKVATISGFKIAITRSDIEGWLIAKRIEAAIYSRQWWWAIRAFVVGSLATAVILLSVGVKDRLLAIYSFSGAVGWLAGAIAYSSVLCAYQRKTKQRAVTWLPLGVSVTALVGFIWWLQYTVRFDLALPAAAIIGPMPPAPMVASAPVTPVPPVGAEQVTPLAPDTPAAVTAVAPVALAPVTPVAPVGAAPETPVAPVTSFTCTRNGNVTVCK